MLVAFCYKIHGIGEGRVPYDCVILPELHAHIITDQNIVSDFCKCFAFFLSDFYRVDGDIVVSSQRSDNVARSRAWF